LLHPARRGRARRRPRRRRRAPRAVPPGRPAGRRGARNRDGDREHSDQRHPRVGDAVRVGRDPARLVRVRRAHGPGRADGGDEDGGPHGELRREPPGRPLPRAVHGAERARRARVHPRPAGHHRGDGRDGRGRGEAPHGLRVPRADAVLPRRGHAHGGADRERGPRGARPVRRRARRDPRRDRRGRLGALVGRGVAAARRAAHRGGARRGDLGQAVLARARGLPGREPALGQVLAAGAPHRRSARGPQPRVLVPAPGVLRDRRPRMTDQQTGAAAGDDAGRRSPLHAEHVALGANLTTFGGWLMPLRYTSGLAEHRAVREAAGLFDLSHMGEIEVAGPQAAAALHHALVGNLSAVAPGRARYTMICQEDGAVLDDLVVYRLAQERFLVVANAGNADLVARELVARAEGFDATVTDQGAETALVAVQGPRAEEIVAGLTDPADPAAAQAVRDLRYYAAVPLALRTDTGPVDALVARTGYTGEDGFELFVPADRAADLWRTTLAAGAPLGLVPAGLSARDSLR